ncbi:unnamed protein product [Orchesella dallaii]|uniref:28S ribosomal protein S22, mitochondrial n=1 Tax=Orchesella dallaii TaxID=48710 RepID=A0ABP1PPQ0_9HEXA
MSRNVQRLGKLWLSLKRTSLSSSVGRPLLGHRAVPSIPLPALSQGIHFSCNQFSQNQDSQTSSKSQSQDEKRIKLFIDPEVQTLLKELTGRDLKRIFRKRKIGQKLKEPKYTFMTEAQLQKAREEAEEKADKLLQMPPVLMPRKTIDEILSFDPCIQLDEVVPSTLIFTDISMNIKDRDRIIVARDPDGTLRQATWQERDKMNAIYFPTEGREFIPPKMFTQPLALQTVLDRASEEDNTYEFVLDRACLQFEPEDPLFINAAETTYETIDRAGHYDFLKSTRHYGPMVFYLVRMRKMDNILLHCIKHGRVTTDADRLVTLFQIIFPECKSKSAEKTINAVDKIKRYIQLDAIRKGELELALNAYVEEEERKAELEEGLRRQHAM